MKSLTERIKENYKILDKDKLAEKGVSSVVSSAVYSIAYKSIRKGALVGCMGVAIQVLTPGAMAVYQYSSDRVRMYTGKGISDEPVEE